MGNITSLLTWDTGRSVLAIRARCRMSLNTLRMRGGRVEGKGICKCNLFEKFNDLRVLLTFYRILDSLCKTTVIPNEYCRSTNFSFQELNTTPQ